MMKQDFHGMSIPGYDMPPLVRIELLEQVQDWLVEYKYIPEKQKVRISDYIDNSFVEKAYKELNKKGQ